MLLGALVLLGLVAVPSDYRGGAAQPHPHSLAQLLLDAADGHLQHEHAPESSTGPSIADVSWFDPLAGATDSTHTWGHTDNDVETGGQHGPVVSYPGMPILPAALIVVAVSAGIRRQLVIDTRRRRGRAPEVLLPPPRRAVTA